MNDSNDIRTSLADIEASLLMLKWMLGFVLALLVALAWRVLQ